MRESFSRTNDIRIGDTISCSDPEGLVNTMLALSEEGIETDFIYSKDGIKGYWLEVKEVHK